MAKSYAEAILRPDLCRILDGIAVLKKESTNRPSSFFGSLLRRQLISHLPIQGGLEETSDLVGLFSRDRARGDQVSRPQRAPVSRVVGDHLREGEDQVVGVAFCQAIAAGVGCAKYERVSILVVKVEMDDRRSKE